MSLDFSDPSKLQTRDGREVRIYATDHGGKYPIAGAIAGDGLWIAKTWTKHGEEWQGTRGDGDLIPKPTRITGWVNVYIDPNGNKYFSHVFATRKEVASKKSNGCIGQIHIDAEVQT